MLLTRYKNYTLAAFLMLSSATVFSAESKEVLPKPHTSADWFFNVRTNVNSASIISGTWAVCDFLYKSGYETFQQLNKPNFSFKEILKPALKSALPFAGFAVALWCVDKGWLRNEYYKRVQRNN